MTAQQRTPSEWLLARFDRRIASGAVPVTGYPMPMFALKEDHELHYGTCRFCTPPQPYESETA